MNKFQKILSYLLYIPLLLIIFLLQAVVLPRLPIMGARPLLLPLTVVGVAMFSNANEGGIYGLFAGILCDISLNQPVIQFTLLLTAVGLFIGYASEKFIVRSFPTYLLCCILVLTVSAFAQSFELLFFYHAKLLPCAEVYIVQTLYSLLFTLPIYYFSKKIVRLHRS